MPPDHDQRDLAFFKSLSEPVAGQRPRHLGAAAMLLPVLDHPTAAAIPARLDAALVVHGKDHRHADLRIDAVHLGAGQSGRFWAHFSQADHHKYWRTCGSGFLPMCRRGDKSKSNTRIEHA